MGFANGEALPLRSGILRQVQRSKSSSPRGGVPGAGHHRTPCCTAISTSPWAVGGEADALRWREGSQPIYGATNAMSQEDFPAHLEAWLERSTRAWSRLPKREYLRFFDRWRRTFAPLFRGGRPSSTGSAALDDLEARLPCDVVLFCDPDHHPNGTGHPFFAFTVEGLRRMDRILFHAEDVIVAEQHLGFCCICTHEVGVLADPGFWLAPVEQPPEED